MILAAYGAVLSTVVFVWNIARSRSTVRVKVVYGIEEVKGKSVHGVVVSVQNPSASAVHLTHVSLLYPWRPATLKDVVEMIFRFRRMPRRIGWVHTSLSNFGVDSGCPIKLEPGMSHRILVPHDAIEKMLSDAASRQFAAVAQDALWRDKFSRVFEYPREKSSK